MAFGPIFFAAPLTLLALAALPILIWLLRATPPAPTRVQFPPLRLLLGLRTDDIARKRAPLWLLLLRALVAALVILGFARPSLRADPATQARPGPVLLVVDDGWAAAPHWAAFKDAALAAVTEAEQAGQGPITLVTTAPGRGEPPPLEALDPADARARINRLEPKPWRADRALARERLADAAGPFASVVWIADGLADPGADGFGRALSSAGPLTVRLPERPARALVRAEPTPEGVEVDIVRSALAEPTGAVAAETLEGRSLGAAEFSFDGARTATALIALPPEIAARAARVRLVSEESAAAVRLLPSGAGRPVVGLAAAGGAGPPLLSDLFYVERALGPFATVRRADLASLVDQRAQAIVLADAARPTEAEVRALEAWLDEGGLLIRFAGPRLANTPDALSPAPLRQGARALGGALAWERPQRLAPFPATSPFAGLTPPAEVTVSRQVLVDPALVSQAFVWASLEDGTPVVTAAPRGKGLLVLFHVTAGPAWSDLALSGLFVDMLKRTLAFSGRAEAAQEETSSGPYSAERVFDGFGALGAPPQRILAEGRELDAEAPSPRFPPGLYTRAGSPARSVNAAREDETLEDLSPPPGARLLGVREARSASLAGAALGAAAGLAALDLLLALALAGGVPRFARAAAACGLGVLLLAAAPSAARAQVNLDFPPGWGLRAPPLPEDIEPPGDVQLAFVETGDARLDQVTRQGLEALSRALYERTAVEPGPVVGVDLATDDLSLFPVLYWAAPANPRPLSAAAAANLDRYMRLGGMVFLDTRDAGRARGDGESGPAAVLLEGVDAPPLEPVANDAVISRSFYLLKGYTGRTRGAKLWAESAGAAAARDGVASLMIGDGDWAAAWAASGFQALGGPSRQEELALRFGVNLVMVALTGNYKADQVHIPELLRRLGRRGSRP